MSTLEERIRRGLGADVPASADDLISAAAAGARRTRRQHRWAVGLGAAGAALATAAVIAIATLPADSDKPSPPQPAETTELPTDGSTEAPSSPPSAADWPLELGTDGSSVYLVTRSCPGTLRDGHCETLGGYDGTRFVSGHEQGRSTVSLWRYDGAWTELGEVPGISRAAQDSSAAYTLSWSMRREAMSVGPGAVVLGSTFGELVVSGDGGETWETWRLPWRPSECQNGFVPCSVAVSGDYVVAAAEDTWLRRKVGSDEWEDITPPGRARYNLADDGRYGLLALDDGTLVATADDIVAKTGAYRVSTDSGSTWSDPRPNPGDHSQFDWTAGVQGPAVYAGCWMPDGRGCGYYRSTDLVRWAKVAPDQGPESPCPGQGYVEPESVIQVGTLTYAIAHVPYLDGHPATTQKQLGSLDFPHDVRHVLRVSGDDCRTWQPVPE